jgi:LytS/YehU family sensor histidine kinase
LDRNGEISVCFSGINENLMIEIRDNGNGIGQTTIVEKKSSDHKSLSTKITRERLAQLSESAKTELVIEPIHDEFGVITGTYVKIAIPLKLKKR